ncbi:hypothetical protein [Celeribacter neptunius]|uniref:Uncharacterized protein n=1 Tax=Celeribacter neptunius TaxID=588602 RepID=A0A1I3KYV3_9RHOB|nr:hypothetical protein [Celeribacter neptunius]SFI77653.1 hypothetical protein SAMN04487991_0839 [Celeribacter neptunius]
MVPFFPINLPKIDPQVKSLYRAEREAFEAELQRLEAARPRWWRRVGRWLRPEPGADEQRKTAHSPETEGRLQIRCAER